MELGTTLNSHSRMKRIHGRSCINIAEQREVKDGDKKGTTNQIHGQSWVNISEHRETGPKRDFHSGRYQTSGSGAFATKTRFMLSKHPAPIRLLLQSENLYNEHLRRSG